jgi:hypothetical protein
MSLQREFKFDLERGLSDTEDEFMLVELQNKTEFYSKVEPTIAFI